MPNLTSADTVSRHLKRYQQVVRVLVKYGFHDLVSQLRLWEEENIGKRISHRSGRQFVNLAHAQRVRLAMEELGPTFVKLGQLLSTRPDLVPHDLILEMEKLQSRVAPFPSHVARDIIQSELGRSIDKSFASFEKETAFVDRSLGRWARRTQIKLFAS